MVIIRGIVTYLYVQYEEFGDLFHVAHLLG